MARRGLLPLFGAMGVVACGGATVAADRPPADGGANGSDAAGAAAAAHSGVSGSSGSLPSSSGGSGSAGGSGVGSGSTGGPGSVPDSGAGDASGPASGSGSATSGSTTANDAGACPSPTVQTFAVKVTVPVGWPSTMSSNSGEGNLYVWSSTTLTRGTDNTTDSGSMRLCGMTFPVLGLVTGGGPPMGVGPQVKVTIPSSTFDAITRTFPTTGAQAGSNPGDAITQNTTVAALGLAAGSGYLTDSTAWPPDCAMSNPSCSTTGSFAAADISDDDADGHPGITETPISTAPYRPPPVSPSLGGDQGPSADRIYVALREEMALSGLRMTDCVHGSGIATVTLFDTHVVGCRVAAAPDAGASDCTSAQASFLDQTRARYVVKGSETSSNPSAISPSYAVTGSFTLLEITANATCSDVIAALP